MGTTHPDDGGGSETVGPSGWTNEHVRSGFDVDGSQSSIHPIGMNWRIRLAQAIYEALGDTGRTLSVGGRSLYPVIRQIGALLDRNRAAEQAIAEHEYVLQEMAAIERTGIGSRRWLLGWTVFIGYWLLIVVIAVAVFGALAGGLVGILTGVVGIASSVAWGVTGGLLIVGGITGLGVSLYKIYKEEHG